MSIATPPMDQTVRDEIRANLDVNLCVEAGAGTGKTTSLVSRIVELLASGAADVDSLVVITFTEKAAAELSARVREALEAAIAAEADENRRNRLIASERALYRARIETIHSFAGNLLRERPVEAGIDPEFAVMGELEADLSFDSAYNAWLDELMAEAHPEVERALNVGFGLDELRQSAETLNRLRFVLPLVPFDRAGTDAGRLVEWIRDHRSELDQIAGRCIDETDKGLANLERLESFAARLDVEGTTPGSIERLVAVAAPRLKAAGRQGSWPDKSDCIRMKELLADYSDLRKETVEGLRNDALVGVLPHVERFVFDYEARRRAEGVADFDDLLIWARNLLRDNLPVRRYFQQRFRRILIDEFQDTDPIQVEIAIYLTSDGQDESEWRSLRPVAGKLFVVGDPKQSIYRFRRADIAIYDEVKRRLLADGVREIVQNFRSVPGVLDWVNNVFDELLVERSGVQPRNVRLVAPDGMPREDQPPVVVLRGSDDTLNAEGVRELEARSVAGLLREAVVDDPWTVRDRVSGTARPARWRDIAILLPARTGLDAYEAALANAGIPHRHEGSRDYFRRQEVRDLIALLHAIDDPTDRFHLVGTLRSSAFGCSDQDLIVHVATGGAWDYRPDAESDAPKVNAAFSMLRGLYRARRRLSLPELVRAAVEESLLVEFALTLPDGPQAAANLLAIVDQARSFSAAGGGGLRAFARWLSDSTENEAEEIDAGISEETDNVVRLLTMHASKGLEFPIVVLANLASQGVSFREPLPAEAERRVHFRVGSGGRNGHYATPGYDDRWEQEKEALEAERIRLLYVASTRARDHLVVPCFEGKRKAGPFFQALDPLLPQLGRADDEAEGMRLVDASELPPPPEVDEIAAEVTDADIEAALEERERWAEDHAAVIATAREELPVAVATSVERSMRPMAAEASHSGQTLVVSQGPPLPVGDALHFAMERVSLPGAEDLDEVVRAVCAEGDILDREDEVAEMARRCLASPAVQRALESGAYWREVPFTVAADGGFLSGRMDLVYGDDDGLVVVDYKSDVVAPDECEQYALDHHAGQAETYMRALTDATGLAVEGVVFVFARAGMEVIVRP